MHCRHDGRVSFHFDRLAAVLRYAKLGAEERLGCGGSEADDEPGADGFYLSIQPGAACCDFAHGGFFMDAALAARLPLEVLYGIRDVCSAALDAGFFQAGVEQTARGSDEGTASEILLIAGLLTNEQNRCRGATLSEDGLRGIAIEVATAALFGGCQQRPQIVSRGKKIDCGYLGILWRHIAYDAAALMTAAQDAGGC